MQRACAKGTIWKPRMSCCPHAPSGSKLYDLKHQERCKSQAKRKANRGAERRRRGALATFYLFCRHRTEMSTKTRPLLQPSELVCCGVTSPFRDGVILSNATSRIRMLRARTRVVMASFLKKLGIPTFFVLAGSPAVPPFSLDLTTTLLQAGSSQRP